MSETHLCRKKARMSLTNLKKDSEMISALKKVEIKTLNM